MVWTACRLVMGIMQKPKREGEVTPGGYRHEHYQDAPPDWACPQSLLLSLVPCVPHGVRSGPMLLSQSSVLATASGAGRS